MSFVNTIAWRLIFPRATAYVCLVCGATFKDPDQHDFELCWRQHQQKEEGGASD